MPTSGSTSDHQDWPNNSLMQPAPLGKGGGVGEAVALHIYLDDVDECGGPTQFVPARGPTDPGYTAAAMGMMPGVNGHPRLQARTAAEEYFREVDAVSTRVIPAIWLGFQGSLSERLLVIAGGRGVTNG